MFFGKKIKKWEKYTSKKENFSILFPFEVKRQFFGYFSDDGLSPGSVLYGAQSNRIFSNKPVYQVAVTRVKEYYGEEKDFLETALNEFVKSVNSADSAKLESSDFIKFNNLNAIKYSIDILKIYKITGIIFLSVNTVYNISVLFDSKNENDFEKFVNSFSLKKATW